MVDQVCPHYKNTPIKKYRFFLVVKMKIFTGKFFDIFLIFAQIIDCGWAVLTNTHNLCFGSYKTNRYNPTNPCFFFYLKMGFKGVFIA